MQRWEYMTVAIVRSYGTKYRVNGTIIAEWNDIPLYEMLQRAGRQGFELVAIDEGSYIFKRPFLGRTGPLRANTGEQTVNREDSV